MHYLILYLEKNFTIRRIIVFILLVFVPISIYAEEKALKKVDACVLNDGKYDLYSGELQGYNSLEAFWLKGKMAKVVGFLKDNNSLYYGVTVFGEKETFSDLYLYKYSCLTKSSKKITYLFRHAGENRKIIASFFSTIDQSSRYYLVGGGILGGGGGNWGVFDKLTNKYSDIFFWKNYKLLNTHCGENAGPEGCFQKIIENKNELMIILSRQGKSEVIDKYKVDLYNKKFIKL